MVRLPGNNRRVVHMEHMSPRDDVLSGSPVPSPDSFSFTANAAPVLDKPSVPVEPTRPPAVVQTPVRRSQPQVNTPVVAQSPATQDAPTGDMPLRRSNRHKTRLVIAAVMLRKLPGIIVLSK